MALLHICGGSIRRFRFIFFISIINFRVRKREDEEFVRRLAQEMGLTLAVGRGDVIGKAAKSKTSLEMAAQEYRYRFLPKGA